MTQSTLAPVSARPLMGGVALLLLLETGLILSWSAGFVGVRFAADHAPISLILLWRSLVSGLVLLPFAVLLGPRMRRAEVFGHMLFGGLAMTGYLGSFAVAIGLGVPTGLVALITDMLPLAVAILSWPVLGQALNARQWLGTFIGLAGVVLASGWSISLGDVPVWAYTLPALGTLALALAVLLQKRAHTPTSMPVYQSLCIQCLSAALVFGVFAWFDGGVMPVLTVPFAGGILWLAFVATFGAWGLYYLALRKSSPARVTAILYLSPPVTMIWAWLMFNEPLSWAMAGGLVVSLAGIIILARATAPSA